MIPAKSGYICCSLYMHIQQGRDVLFGLVLANLLVGGCA